MKYNELNKHNSTREAREKAFLEFCGFDLSNGYWSEDVERYIQDYPVIAGEFDLL